MIKTIREAADYLSDCAYSPTWSEKLHAIADSMEKAEPDAWVVEFDDHLTGEHELNTIWNNKQFANDHLNDGISSGAFEETSNQRVTPFYRHPADDAKDAERYRFLRDNYSYSYPMQPDSPAEHGIEYHWQQCTYEERNFSIENTIDAAIAEGKE